MHSHKTGLPKRHVFGQICYGILRTLAHNKHHEIKFETLYFTVQKPNYTGTKTP